MKSKTSFFHKGVIVNDLKRFGWIGVGYFLALFLSIPLKVIMTFQGNQLQYIPTQDDGPFYLFDHEFYIQFYLMFTVPVLLAIALFRYLHVKKRVDTLHSLPVKREVWFRTHIAVGSTILILPVCINALILQFVMPSVNGMQPYTTEDIFIWLGTTILINMVMFMLSVFTGIITGLTPVQGILTYIFLVLVPGLGVMATYNLNIFVYGFPFAYDFDDARWANMFSPLVRVIRGLEYNLLDWNEVLSYIVICIAFYIISRYLYKKRHLEYASQAIAFDGLQTVFKYGVTFCMMLFGGFLIRYTRSIYFILGIYLMFSFLGYIIAEMVLKKSLKVFRHLKGYGIYLCVITVLLLGIAFDVTGYQRYVPKQEAIETIYFRPGFGYYRYHETKDSTEKRGFYSQSHNLEAMRALHMQLVKDKNQLKPLRPSTGERSQTIAFAYQLKNGKEILREYVIPDQKYSQYFKAVHESMEFKTMYRNILKVNHANVDKIIIRPNIWYPDALGPGKKVVIIEPAQIKEALEILQDEVKNEKYEDMMSGKSAWADVQFLLDDDTSVKDRWEKSYILFEKWLEQNGYIQGARVMPEDIAYIAVKKNDPEQDGYRGRQSHTAVNHHVLKITDSDAIEFCLRNCTNEGYKAGYAFTFYSEYHQEDRPVLRYQYLEHEKAPDVVKAYFEKTEKQQ